MGCGWGRCGAARPTSRPSPSSDYETVRNGGLIFAALAFVVGLIIILSEWGWPYAGRGCCAGPHLFSKPQGPGSPGGEALSLPSQIPEGKGVSPLPSIPPCRTWELTDTRMDRGTPLPARCLPAWSLDHTEQSSRFLTCALWWPVEEQLNGRAGWSSLEPSSVHGVRGGGNQSPRDASLGQIWSLSFLGMSYISVHVSKKNF